MSDRYVLFPKCAWCGKRNGETLFQFDWARDFKCEHCGKKNEIDIEFKIYKTRRKKK